ncbi:MAG TPA: hypothetical protein DEO65_04345 [Bacillus bacterium]|uniref:hypothetical protein n=1 Tax=Siminovitchia fordii TaxID=254759 RepID=UPI00036D3192|nr:hypothetical protein [Siminovitchia fordii]HBZ09105.1 hypothetical protein [Bacillus sp. (in: firmicutes)]
MIIEEIYGSKDTTLHDFSILIEGNNLIVSPGTLWVNNEIVFQSMSDQIFEIGTNPWSLRVEEGGINLRAANIPPEDSEIPNCKIELAWMEEGNIYFRKIVDEEPLESPGIENPVLNFAEKEQVDLLGKMLVEKEIQLMQLQAINKQLGEVLVMHDIRLMGGGL